MCGGSTGPYPASPSRVGKSSTFLIFPQISINFCYFSSNFSHFLPHFGYPGGWVAHSGRPWLRYWALPLVLFMISWKFLLTKWKKKGKKKKVKRENGGEKKKFVTGKEENENQNWKGNKSWIPVEDFAFWNQLFFCPSPPPFVQQNRNFINKNIKSWPHKKRNVTPSPEKYYYYASGECLPSTSQKELIFCRPFDRHNRSFVTLQNMWGWPWLQVT